MKGISRVFVANRGEIATRILRACGDLKIESVIAVSEADKDSLPAKMAGRAVCIGPPEPVKSYLSVNTIIAAALGTGSDAIHPGYGFLAEQPELSEACVKNGLIFIGPKPDHIRTMGDKLLAREMVKELGIPVIPGSELVRDIEEAKRTAEKVGYPILLKAAAGGGGKGMKTVKEASHLRDVFQEASAEAQGAFGDDRLYIEHFIPDARHIEIQIVGDGLGNVVHLYERDCSLQRRYQKMVEEAPSPVVTPEIREAMCASAIQIAGHIKYENAGTVEFILDQAENKFYFLEMNTRIQVEHPVTEMITGVDLVKEQFKVASEHAFSFSQKDLSLSGHAIECRINAELPQADFRPCPGKITMWEPPSGEGIRLDTHCYAEYFVPPYYDSLLAKLITADSDRSNTIGKMQRALDSFVVGGVDTTISFYEFVMKNRDYIKGSINTRWIEEILLKEFEKDEGNKIS